MFELTFMAFSLGIFCIAAFLELCENQMVQNSGTHALASSVAEIAASLDANLGNKFHRRCEVCTEAPEMKKRISFT